MRVWEATVHTNDGSDGGDSSGLFTSQRKARAACRNDAGLGPRKRVRWIQIFDLDMYFWEFVQINQVQSVYDGEVREEQDVTRYYVKRRRVQ